MAKTKTLALSTTPLAITAVTQCKTITVMEDRSVANWPTVDLKIRKPANTDDPLTLAAGQTYAFTAQQFWQAGDTVGYLQTATGTTTGVQDET